VPDYLGEYWWKHYAPMHEKRFEELFAKSNDALNPQDSVTKQTEQNPKETA
jgi:hypothetical protein